ncbi:MAG: family 78 glycoside hydrolase catalytic domain, partial [Eubacteriales bacterium]|nr:family 78 glycoside hydrolase catalytic domain [Eubacteriales bacterium]
MLKITRFTCENKERGCVTDKAQPCFSYALESDREGTETAHAEITVNKLTQDGEKEHCTWKAELKKQIAAVYKGEGLEPFTMYKANITVTDNHGETAEKELTFETGRMDEAWTGQWITDGSYSFKDAKISPIPMTFRKKLELAKPVKSARIYATALGIYDLFLDGSKVGEQYFAPGFTSYKTHLQYQTYDVTEQIAKAKELTAIVAGGWAVGSFVFTRKNRITADRQALLLELHLEYEDGTAQVVGSDESWEVSMDGRVKMADLYDGETYDATVLPENMTWRKAALETVKIHPEIMADYGAPVVVERELTPTFLYEKNGELIYDFKQNFAGVVKLHLTGKKGQKVEVHHAEILNQDGTLNLQFLRTAKATAAYICKDGEQTYSPTMSYMGFRYISIKGVEKDQVEPTALVLSSGIRQIGGFTCSDERINRLQENIFWSSRSNFMDIPTDCPQRDERMGWTGDIAVFAQTACFNFDMSRFLQKW